MIGDYDPEDAYDADDPPGVRLRVLEAIVADLYAAIPTIRVVNLAGFDALRLVEANEAIFAEWRSRLEAIRHALEDL